MARAPRVDGRDTSMASPKLPWPSVLLALVGAGAMLWAEAGLGLTASVVLLWLGTLWLAQPAPVASQGGGGGVRLTRARMEDLIEPLGIVQWEWVTDLRGPC